MSQARILQGPNLSYLQLSSLTYSSVDYLYIRRKFDFPDESSLITWYTHLRWV